MKTVLHKIDTWLARFENALIVVIVSIMFIFAFIQVVLRAAGYGLLWGDPFLRHLVFWVGFVGASLATRDEKHIRIDALTRITSPKILPYIQIVIDIVTAVICIILTDAGLTFVQYEKEAQTVLFNAYDIDFHTWIFQVIIPLGFALLSFRFLLKATGKIVLLISGQPVHRSPNNDITLTKE